MQISWCPANTLALPDRSLKLFPGWKPTSSDRPSNLKTGERRAALRRSLIIYPIVLSPCLKGLSIGGGSVASPHIRISSSPLSGRHRHHQQTSVAELGRVLDDADSHRLWTDFPNAGPPCHPRPLLFKEEASSSDRIICDSPGDDQGKRETAAASYRTQPIPRKHTRSLTPRSERQSGESRSPSIRGRVLRYRRLYVRETGR